MHNIAAEIIIEAVEPLAGVVIWLHGLGADQHDLIPLAQQLGSCRRLRQLFVQAPEQAISINQGVSMPGWYDLHPEDMGLSGIMRDQNGVHQQLTRIAGLIQNQCANGIAPERIIVAGFSQGGSMALACALAFADKLGAAISLSGWLLCNPLPVYQAHHRHPGAVHTVAKREPALWTPALIHHGRFDEVVPHQASAVALSRLEALGMTTHAHSFAGGHEIQAEQIPLIDQFITQTLTVDNAPA
ncbi:MAG: alpha/beta hydrolase fold domain-containing protein [Gammaproteobacteria bacterium]|nr:alpha/beta hydrolase fold domain-containing protein [Pseudomonadota bacterium]MCH9663787.1 alpha/beta hydrolase fold domain-containing protein [Gammaproteobacteria bacterium]